MLKILEWPTLENEVKSAQAVSLHAPRRGVVIVKQLRYNISMATRKPKERDYKMTAANLNVRLTETSRAQLHYLLVERALTMPDEKPTISRLIAEAIGKLARSKGWKAK